MHGTGRVASPGIPDGGVSLQPAGSHARLKPRALGLHGLADPLQSQRSGVGTSRPQHDPARHRILPKPTRVGKRTISGTRAAVRTVISYRNGVLNGKGASLLDGYMEDLATDRIYRLMIAQRVTHRDKVPLTDDNGKPVKHTPELITR